MEAISLLFCCMGIFGSADTAAIENAFSNLPDIATVSLPPIDQVTYFEFDNTVFQQAILPQLKFTSYGTITSFSALTVANSFDRFIDFVPHEISFTVWRPRGAGLYDVVGHTVLKFGSGDLRAGRLTIDNSSGLVPEDLDYFNFTDKEPDYTNPLSSGPVSFQPGDVLGWNQLAGTTKKPLSLVYVQSNSTDAVDGFRAPPSQEIPCSLSECNVGTSTLSSIIPYFSVQYVTTAPNASELSCESLGMEQLNPCPTTSTPAVTTTRSTTATSSIIIIIAAPSVVIVAALGLGIFLVVIVLLYCKAKRRALYLVKLRAGEKYQLEDNPQYDSAGEHFHANNLHRPSDMKIDFESEDKDLYAIPSNIRVETRNTTAKLEELFDGECYASTYQTNGQCHVYQELSEASQQKPRTRSMSVATSHNVLNRPRPHLSLRMTASSASATGFPYTMPNTPALSVFDLETKPSFQVFPYTESTPSVNNMAGSSCMMSRPSAASSSFMEKPSISTLPHTPEDTPPSSATVDSGPTMRKLFHAVDDELIRVPNAMERQELMTMDNPDEIYSKLKHSYSNQNRDSVDAVFLDQPDYYWAPSSDPNELYDQLAKRKFREIQRKQVRVTDCIGSGNFGTVYKGLWQIPGGVMPVAIKTLNPNSPDDNEIKFLKEAAIMGQFLHTNVVKLLGVVTVGEPLMIVLELMPKGDLKQYLRSLDYASSNSMIKEDLPSLLLSFCRQIGYGMNYLANKAFVHRDLAARNILLAEDLTCKIGDFGMSRDLEEETVYFSQGGKLPLRWTAPEALKYHQFSSASDVWSYGMLLFEIWSLGKKPFDGILTKRLMTLVYSGFCQPPPPGCPRAIYKMMVECWHTEAEKRITFSQICSRLNSSSSAETLLTWNKEDGAVSARVQELGAPLSESRKLYVDLQFMYTNSLV